MAFVVFFCSPIRAQQTAQDFTDVTIRTGAQLSGRLEQLIKGPNVRAAALYFGDQKANPSPAGLAEVSAQNVRTKEKVSLFFIPFTEPTPTPGVLKLVVSADGSNGEKVLLGTVTEEPPGAVNDRGPRPGQTPKLEVKDEHLVRDGKVGPSDASLEKWVYCALGPCAAGIGCLLEGITPVTVGCLCVTCGASMLGCYGQIYR
jgi:hypothetical protein